MIPDGPFPVPEGEPLAGRGDRPERTARDILADVEFSLSWKSSEAVYGKRAGQRQWPDPLCAVRGEAR